MKNAKETKLDIPFYISWYMDELITRLHKEYPGTEWSWVARVQKFEDAYVLTDIVFPKQHNSASNTEMTWDWLHEALMPILESDPESIWEWNCWLHSHHSMSVFRSGTDDTARQSFNDGMTKHRWSVVTAHSWPGGSTIYKCALDIYKPAVFDFDIPVLVEEFDKVEFYRDNITDYDEMNRQLGILKEKREEELIGVEQCFVKESSRSYNIGFDEKDIDHVLSVIGEDHKEVVDKILSEKKIELEWKEVSNIKAKRDKGIIDTNKLYDEASNEIVAAFSWDVFWAKIQELKDNIIKPKRTKTKYYGRGYGKGYSKWVSTLPINQTSSATNLQERAEAAAAYYWVGGAKHYWIPEDGPTYWTNAYWSKRYADHNLEDPDSAGGNLFPDNQ